MQIGSLLWIAAWYEYISFCSYVSSKTKGHLKNNNQNENEKY